MTFIIMILFTIVIPLGIMALILIAPAYIMDYVTKRKRTVKSTFIYDAAGYNSEGYDRYGRDKEGYDRNGYDREGYDRRGYDKDGYDRNGYDRDGYSQLGVDRDGFDRSGFNNDGYDRDGYGKNGLDKDGFDREGYNQLGIDRDGFDKSGFNSDGYNRYGYDREGFNKDGYDNTGFDKNGFDEDGYDREGYNQLGIDRGGFDKSGFNSDGYNRYGYDREGFNKDGYDNTGFDKNGFDEDGYDREGYNQLGIDRGGFDKGGFNKDGYDSDGFDKNGCDKNGVFSLKKGKQDFNDYQANLSRARKTCSSTDLSKRSWCSVCGREIIPHQIYKIEKVWDKYPPVKRLCRSCTIQFFLLMDKKTYSNDDSRKVGKKFIDKNIGEGHIVRKDYNSTVVRAYFDMNLYKRNDSYDYAQDERMKQLDKPKGSIEYFIKVAGVTYDNRQSAIMQLKEGDSLRFVPEPNNRFDNNAVRVETMSGEQVGYIPKEKNRNIFNNLINNVGIYQVTVSKITGGRSYQNYGVNAKVVYTPLKNNVKKKYNKTDLRNALHWEEFYYEDELDYQEVDYSDFETYYGGMDDDFDEYS